MFCDINMELWTANMYICLAVTELACEGSEKEGEGVGVGEGEGERGGGGERIRKRESVRGREGGRERGREGECVH